MDALNAPLDAPLPQPVPGGPPHAPLLQRKLPQALLEALDRDGHVRQAWRLDHWPVTIGRSLDCDIVLTDPHVAAHHASLELDEAGAIVARAGETKNGIGIAGKRLAGGQARVLPDPGHDLELQIGRSTLRLRLGAHLLAAERVLAPEPGQRQRWLPTVLLATAVLAIVAFNSWLHADPDGFERAAGSALLTTLSGGAIWCGLWALLSKTLTRRAHLGWHARVFTLASLILLGVAAAAPLFAFAFSAPWVTDFSFVAVYAAFAAALYYHLLAVEPARRRLLRAVIASGFVAGVGLSIWFNLQRTARPGEELYMNHLLPPQLRAARPVAVDAFVTRLAPMQAVLDRQAQEKDYGSDAAAGNDEE